MRYALIGCGRVAPSHIKAAKANGLEIVALCDIEKEKAKALAKQVYMIAVISQRSFTQEELEEFIDSSIELLYNA